MVAVLVLSQRVDFFDQLLDAPKETGGLGGMGKRGVTVDRASQLRLAEKIEAGLLVARIRVKWTGKRAEIIAYRMQNSAGRRDSRDLQPTSPRMRLGGRRSVRSLSSRYTGEGALLFHLQVLELLHFSGGVGHTRELPVHLRQGIVVLAAGRIQSDGGFQLLSRLADSVFAQCKFTKLVVSLCQGCIQTDGFPQKFDGTSFAGGAVLAFAPKQHAPV